MIQYNSKIEQKVSLLHAMGWFSACLFILLLQGCKHDNLTVPQPNENIRPAADFIHNNYEMRLFDAALEKTGLNVELNGNGPFTVLVPNDLAFNEIGVFRPADLDRMNKDSLRRLISYHILPRRLYVSDIPSNSVDFRYATLEGSELYASIGSISPGAITPTNMLFFSGAKAVRKDVVLSNGVLHVLDKLMKPQFEKNIQDWLSDKKDYTVFVAGLKKFGLWEQLAEKGPFTVFAPTNEALQKRGVTMEFLDSAVPQNYVAEVLFGAYIMYDKHFFISDSQVFTVINSNGNYKYHLKDKIHYMEYFANEAYPTWKLSYNMRLRDNDTFYSIILADVTYAVGAKMDYLCSNGLVHDLDQGLVSPDQAIKKGKDEK
ncbi:fasciclin domain-containing protein [Sphingobacterium siyangense]|uniref:fasciclin domain-containing protein n=1 Tax=Sphingobacterium siyangense TaxID=459529 RepID=UPI001966460A|nr:fasciclin domain-containing protein [Sphingobacterium siyangense]QRY57417.1 fasciclin domain-containing protein [Sphingobacterium siyangense]